MDVAGEVHVGGLDVDLEGEGEGGAEEEEGRFNSRIMDHLKLLLVS